MKEHQRYPDRFIKTDSVSEPLELTVKEIMAVKFPDGSDGTAASFFEDERMLALNRTRYRSIRELAQDDEDANWDGTKIEVYRTTTTFGSDTNKPCLRIRRPGENGTSATAAKEEESLPF